MTSCEEPSLILLPFLSHIKLKFPATQFAQFFYHTHCFFTTTLLTFLFTDYYSNSAYKTQTKSPVALRLSIQSFADAACQFQDAESHSAPSSGGVTLKHCIWGLPWRKETESHWEKKEKENKDSNNKAMQSRFRLAAPRRFYMHFTTLDFKKKKGLPLLHLVRYWNKLLNICDLFFM